MADKENTQGQGQGQQPRQRPHKKARRRSDVYEHFTCFRDAQGNDKARCRYCDLVLGASTKNGTSNLRTHVRICKARDGESTNPTSSSLPQPQYLPQLLLPGPGESSDREPSGREEDEASRDLARMIALHGYDPSIVEDDYFRSFVRRLDPEFEVPSREAIEEMCIGIFQDSQRELYRSIEDDPVKVSLAVGEAKTIETGQVVYMTTHFIDRHWNLHRAVDDVCMALPVGDQYHVPLRRVPVVSLDGVVDWIVSVTYPDNELFIIVGETTGHINHLKLKGCMEQEWGKKISSATYMDHVLRSVARCLLPDSNFAEYIFNTIKELQWELLPEHQEILTKRGLAKLGLLDDPWEYDERWYSCYCSLEILGQTFPDGDFECPVLLRTLWGAIYHAIKRVSDSSRPTSNICLQELFKVRDVLQLQALDAAHAGDYRYFGNKNVADVLREALKTVDKAIQDCYLVWSIPLVLDPRYKLRSIKDSFERAFGSGGENYVSEVRRKTKEIYSSYIEDVDGDAETMKELDDYLQHSLARGTEGFDILNWWKVHGSVEYPTVAWMARDALAMPTCSKLSPDQIAQVKSMLGGYQPCKW